MVETTAAETTIAGNDGRGDDRCNHHDRRTDDDCCDDHGSPRADRVQRSGNDVVDIGAENTRFTLRYHDGTNFRSCCSTRRCNRSTSPERDGPYTGRSS